MTARDARRQPGHRRSPNGWHNTDSDAARETTNTTGNNVHAYADRNADNVPDPGSSPTGRGRGQPDLRLPAGSTGPPRGLPDAAVTNLFYWNNIIHDVLYNYGFNEKSGNFQAQQLQQQRQGGDDGRTAEAQDGSGRNNANFATPPDGFAPRMQMFEWRDSASATRWLSKASATFSGPHGRVRRQPGHHRDHHG